MAASMSCGHTSRISALLSFEAERALQSFFQRSNLIALRELSLRQAANRLRRDVDEARQERAAQGPWAASERLLVCVGPSPTTAKLIRSAKRMGAANPFIIYRRSYEEMPANEEEIEECHEEATDGHGETRNGDDIAEHRARLHGEERHGNERCGSEDAGASIDETREEAVGRKEREEPPDGERETPCPVVKTEELEAKCDRRERQLGTPKIIQVRQRIVRIVEGEHEVFSRFGALKEHRTAVLITHRFGSVRMADRILVLEGGAIIEDGTHADLVEKGARYARLFELQARGYQ